MTDNVLIDRKTLEQINAAMHLSHWTDKFIAAHAAVKAALAAPCEPVFWYRPVSNREMYEGPHHNNSKLGKMMRDEKPSEWEPLYAAPKEAP